VRAQHRFTLSLEGCAPACPAVNPTEHRFFFPSKTPALTQHLNSVPPSSKSRAAKKSAAVAPPENSPPLPIAKSIDAVRARAKNCEACDLYKHATQTVFGDGARRPRIVFVGEQPGDQEDQQGRPFVGPAGKLLDTALEQAGIDRSKTYVTNAVKHFKWEPRGKRRIHKKPNSAEIAACRPWLDTELALLKPEVVVCLGATAAQALLGRAFRVTQSRGKILESTLAPHIMATVHPSSILRAPDEDSRHREMANFVADLKKLAKFAK
jgi:DNA polymerase